jgi:uncharacterized damage-inducible protein DinB
MSLSASLLPELDQEMAHTRKALERVPAEKFSWRPHDRSYSFMELANHLARLPGWGAQTIGSESLDLDPDAGEFQPPPPAETPGGVLDAFDQSVAGFRRALEGATDEDLMRPWTLLHGGKELFTMPKVGVLRGMILNHIVHHRGQLTVYLRLNDLPVPAIYGPSADETGM